MIEKDPRNNDPNKLCTICSFDVGKTKCEYKGRLKCKFKETKHKQSQLS